jgi:hypothetical protein
MTAAQFELGGATFHNLMFMAESRLNGEDGILGQDFLHIVDVDYDLSSGVARLVQPKDCRDTNMVYWAKDGQSYSVLPLDRLDLQNPHTQATVLINGVKMRAIFDTGSAVSFITQPAALRAGVKVTDPGVTPGGVSHGLDRDIKSWVAVFSDVKIGDEEIQKTPLMIGETTADFFDVLIGADFFMAHHVYVANSQQKIYFTYSGGPVFDARRVAAPEPAAAK